VLGVLGCGGRDGGGSGDQLGVRVPWIKAASAQGGRAVRVGYEVDPCTRVRGAAVEAGEREVKITLGDSKRDPKKACVGVVERHCALVGLADPLGARKVLDGAPGPRARSRERPIEAYGPCRRVPIVNS
jgi:hypothetical protein